MNAREILLELVRRPSSEHDDPRPVLEFAGDLATRMGAKATSVPNSRVRSALVACVSSITSCSSAAHTLAVSR